MQQWSSRWDAGTADAAPSWDGPRTLVLVLAGPSASEPAELVAQVAATYPTSVVIGCSTSGAFHGDVMDDVGLTVTVCRFERTDLALEVEPITKATSGTVGRVLGERLRARGDGPAAVLVLSEGLRVNGSALAEGLNDALGARCVVGGGLAGDGEHFERTWVLVDGRPAPAHVTAVGFYGPDLAVGHGSDGGWTILGPQREITRSSGNVLFELDGQPALDLYTDYLGERAAGLPATALLFPLAVGSPDPLVGSAPTGPGAAVRERQVVRTVLAVDPEARSMTFAGDVPQGMSAQLMRGTSDRLVEAANQAAQAAAATSSLPTGRTSTGPAVAIAVSCVGRRLYLGQRTEEELEAVVEGLDPDCSLVGFYSYGELSPVADGGCDLMNQTMTMLVLREVGP